MERCCMNKRNAFVFIAGLAALIGCNSTPETPPEPTECLFAVTNVFLSFEGKEESYYKLLNDCNDVEYRNEKGDFVPLKLEDFGIDFDQLIGGDALDITLKGSGDVMILEMMPGRCYIDDQIDKIEVNYADVYSVVIHRNGDDASFSYADGSEGPEINLPYLRAGYCLSQNNETIVKKEFKDYEDGTTLYYSYNAKLNNPLYYSCLYDYNPR